MTRASLPLGASIRLAIPTGRRVARTARLIPSSSTKWTQGRSGRGPRLPRGARAAVSEGSAVRRTPPAPGCGWRRSRSARSSRACTRTTRSDPLRRERDRTRTCDRPVRAEWTPGSSAPVRQHTDTESSRPGRWRSYGGRAVLRKAGRVDPRYRGRPPPSSRRRARSRAGPPGPVRHPDAALPAHARGRAQFSPRPPPRCRPIKSLTRTLEV